MTNSLTVVIKVFSNTLIFLPRKGEMCLQKLLTFFFQQKISMYLPYFKREILTSRTLANTFVKFLTNGSRLLKVKDEKLFMDAAYKNHR